MKRILYIVNHIDWFWSHRVALAQGAKEAGWEVHVAVHGASKDPRFAQHGFTAHELPALSGSLNPIPAMRLLNRIHVLLRDVKPSLVHGITLKHVFFTGLVARLHPVKKVQTIAGLGYLFSAEGMKPKAMRLIFGPFLKLALKDSYVIVQNESDRDILTRRAFIRPEHCILIAGSGVDVAAFQPNREKEENPPLVVMPTRLLPEKGIEIFVKAARILKKRGSQQARFLIAGALAPYAPRAISESGMKAMIADGAVEWPGKVSDMAGLYARASIIVYPSWYREGVPKVLLEAAASGKPIVTTDHPGCRDAVRDGENGILVPVKDAAATAEAIAALLADPGLRYRMGEAGRKRAEQEFDVRLIVRDTLKVYAES